MFFLANLYLCVDNFDTFAFALEVLGLFCSSKGFIGQKQLTVPRRLNMESV